MAAVQTEARHPGRLVLADITAKKSGPDWWRSQPCDYGGHSRWLAAASRTSAACPRYRAVKPAALHAIANPTSIPRARCVHRARIQVSSSKKPIFFYVNLAKRLLAEHGEIQLSALGQGGRRCLHAHAGPIPLCSGLLTICALATCCAQPSQPWSAWRRS